MLPSAAVLAVCCVLCFGCALVDRVDFVLHGLKQATAQAGVQEEFAAAVQGGGGGLSFGNLLEAAASFCRV